jgi:hypothetical protein
VADIKPLPSVVIDCYVVVDFASTVTRQMDLLFPRQFRENHPRCV